MHLLVIFYTKKKNSKVKKRETKNIFQRHRNELWLKYLKKKTTKNPTTLKSYLLKKSVVLISIKENL